MAISTNQINAYKCLNDFLAYAERYTDADTLIHFDEATHQFEVAAGDHIRSFFSPGTTGRNVQANNATRDAFKNALLQLFEKRELRELPESVRDVLKSGDFNDKGRPLSVRRIKAVMTAVVETESYRKTKDYQTFKSYVDGQFATQGVMSADELRAKLSGFTQNVTTSTRFNREDGGNFMNVIHEIFSGADDKGVCALVSGLMAGISTALTSRGADFILAVPTGRKVMVGSHEQNEYDCERTSINGNFNIALDDHLALAKQKMREAFTAANPNLSEADGQVKLDTLFAELDKIVDRIKIRHAVLDRVGDVRLGESTVDRVTVFEKGVDALKKTGYGTNEAIDFVLAEASRCEELGISADQFPAYLKLKTITAQVVRDLGDRMSEAQARRFGELIDTYAKEMAANRGFAEEGRENAYHEMSGILARLAMGGMPLNNVLLARDQTFGNCNSGTADCLVEVGRGHETLVAKLLAYSDKEVANAIFSLHTNAEIAQLENGPMNRATFHRAVLGTEMPPEDANLSETDFARKMFNSLQEQLLERSGINMATNGAKAVMFLSSVMGSVGLLFTFEGALRMVNASQGQLHVTHGDIKAAGQGYDVQMASNNGDAGVRYQLKMDLVRNHSTYTIGGETFDCTQMSEATAEPEVDAMVDRILAKLQTLCQTAEQRHVAGMMLTQGGQSLSANLPTGAAADHGAMNITVTANENGSVTFREVNVPVRRNAPVLDFTFTIQPNGTNFLADLNYTA